MKYFKNKYGRDISHATAIEYLDQLADLHSSFIELLQHDEDTEETLSNEVRKKL